jgi:hypothetical protein
MAAPATVAVRPARSRDGGPTGIAVRIAGGDRQYELAERQKPPIRSDALLVER